MTVQITPDAKVRWTDALLRYCEPTLWTVQQLEQQLDPWPPVADAWRRLREAYLPWADRWRAGELHAGEQRAALMRSVDASFASEAPPPPGSLEVDVEAARGAMCGTVEGGVYLQSGSNVHGQDEYAAMVDFWGAHSGLAFAVLALLRTEDHRRYGDGDSYRDGIRLWLYNPTYRIVDRQPPSAWRRLRRQLAAAQWSAADDYHAARKAAADVWQGLSVRDKCAIAYAFPSENAWSEEAADEGLRVLAERQASSRDYDERVAWLLYSLRDPLRATAVAHKPHRDHQPEEMFATLLANLGVDATGPLFALERGRGPLQSRRGDFWLRVMSAIESEEAAGYLANHLDHAKTNRVAGEYFKRFPYLAAPALKAAAGRGSQEAALLLAGLDPTQAAVVTPETDATPAVAVTPEAAVTMEATVTMEVSASSVDETDLSGVPNVLITPPWLQKRPAPVKPTVLSIEARSLVPLLDWTDAERAEYEKPPFTRGFEQPRTPERDSMIVPELRGNVLIFTLFHLTNAAALTVWQTKPLKDWAWIDIPDLRRLLARLDTEALPNVVAFLRKNAKSLIALEKVVSNDVATLMADAAWRLKEAGKIGEAWLLRYSTQAATQLVPAAVGKPGNERTAAEHALRFLDARQQGDVVRSVAQSYGPACAAAIDGLLSIKAETLPARIPTLPLFWAPTLWPRPTLKDTGRPLPLSAINHLGVMLAASPLDAPMSSLAEVKAACDPASLAQFAWALFEAWQTAGMPTKEGWAFHALGHLGNDDSAQQLVPLIRAWPTAGGLGRATVGLDILAAIGSDTALSLLHGIAQKVKSRPLQQRAAQRMQDVALHRGLTSEQLADRLVPDLDFDASGTRILDFGGRKFRVGLDARLKPEVRTLTGERLRDLPKPGRADDENQAAAAVASWKALKKTVTAVVPAQIARLERAMCESRRWSASDFVAYVVNHPLIGQLARRVIWTARDESTPVASGHGGSGPVATFRVAEDRTFADQQDAPFTLAPTAQVGLLHPLEADAATLAAWTQCLVDYEIIQPFEQLGRRVCRATPEELQATEITRVKNQKVDFGRVLGLERRGWRRGAAVDNGVSSEMIKSLPSANAEASLSIEPGIAAWGIKEFPEQTLGGVFLANANQFGRVRTPVTLSALDPITASELLADLDSLVT